MAKKFAEHNGLNLTQTKNDGKERKAHDNGYGPNRFLLHGGKDKKFLNQLT